MDLWHKTFGKFLKKVLERMSKGCTKRVYINVNHDVVRCDAGIDFKQTKTTCNDLLKTESD